MILTESELINALNKIQKTDSHLSTPCWIWTGAKNSSGKYGNVKLRRLGRSGNFRVHRVMFAHYNKDFDLFDPSAYVCHKCDVPACCNPDHLFVGDHVSNMADMKLKKRSNNGDQSGEKNGNSKLTIKDVLFIKTLLPNFNNTQIVKNHFEGKITHSTVSLIRLGKKWSDVTGINPSGAAIPQNVSSDM